MAPNGYKQEESLKRIEKDLLIDNLKERLAAWEMVFGNMLVYSNKYDREMKAKEVIDKMLEAE